MRILILGGTTEATRLGETLAGRPDLSPILSLAGRTRAPILPALPHRIGGFGGIAGLRAYLAEMAINLVIDATHPFAEQMSRNALAACAENGIPLARFTRPPWQPNPGDAWVSVASAAEATAALGPAPRRVFLTIGRLQLAAFETAPQHQYLIRTIDPPEPMPALPNKKLLLARGPFSLNAELRLLQEERIEILVSKNSGGDATAAKLDAARALGLTMIMVTPPAPLNQPCFYALDALMAWIDGHRPAP